MSNDVRARSRATTGRSSKVITGAAFISLGLMGAFHAFWGTTLPVLREMLDLDIEKAAVLTACNQGGQAVACLVGGLLCDLIRRSKVLMMGCLLLGSGTLLVGGVYSLKVNILVAIWMGLGCGLILSSSNALLAGLYPNRTGTVMNIHHGIYGGVSCLSPVFMGSLLHSDTGWRHGYEGLGCVLVMLFLFFMFARAVDSPIRRGSAFGKDVGRLLMNSNFIFVVLIAALGIGTQAAIIFLSVTFLTGAKGLSVFEASGVLSSFFVCLFVGRLICSWLASRLFATRMILALLLLQLISVIVAWRGNAWVSAGAIVISGLGCSGIFPCMLALTGNLFHAVTGLSLGIVASMIWVGAMTIVWAFGIISKNMTMGSGFSAMVFSSLAAFTMFLFKYRRLKEEEGKHLPSLQSRKTYRSRARVLQERAG